MNSSGFQISTDAGVPHRMESVLESMYWCLQSCPPVFLTLITVLAYYVIYEKTTKILKKNYGSIFSFMIGRLRYSLTYLYSTEESRNLQTCKVGNEGVEWKHQCGLTLLIPKNAIPQGKYFDISMQVKQNTVVASKNTQIITPVAEFTSTKEFNDFVKIVFPVNKFIRHTATAFYRNASRDPWIRIKLNQPKSDIYYTINKESITIYTKHFTQFVCKCDVKDIKLSAYMFASLYEDDSHQEMQLDAFIVHQSVRPIDHYESVRKKHKAIPCGIVQDVMRELTWKSLETNDILEVKCVLQDRGWQLRGSKENENFVTKNPRITDIVRCHTHDPNDIRVTFFFQLSSPKKREKVLAQLNFFVKRGNEREQVYTWTKKIELTRLRELLVRRQVGYDIDMDMALSRHSVKIFKDLTDTSSRRSATVRSAQSHGKKTNRSSKTKSPIDYTDANQTTVNKAQQDKDFKATVSPETEGDGTPVQTLPSPFPAAQLSETAQGNVQPPSPAEGQASPSQNPPKHEQGATETITQEASEEKDKKHKGSHPISVTGSPDYHWRSPSTNEQDTEETITQMVSGYTEDPANEKGSTPVSTVPNTDSPVETAGVTQTHKDSQPISDTYSRKGPPTNEQSAPDITNQDTPINEQDAAEAINQQTPGMLPRNSEDQGIPKGPTPESTVPHTGSPVDPTKNKGNAKKTVNQGQTEAPQGDGEFSDPENQPKGDQNQDQTHKQADSGCTGAEIGTLHVCLQYVQTSQQIQVEIMKVKDLKRSDGKPPDPYVKVRLIVGKARETSTHTVKGTCNPEFKKMILLNSVSSEELVRGEIKFSVKSENWLRRDRLGEAKYDLRALSDGQRVVLALPLQPPEGKKRSFIPARLKQGSKQKKN